MIDKREYLLSCIAEECAEVAERASKAIRFGLFDVRPAEHGGTGLNNWQALAVEYEDLLTSMEALIESEGLVFHHSETARTEKRAKIEKYLNYARSVNQVTQNGAARVILADSVAGQAGETSGEWDGRVAVVLHRSLERLSLAIESCAKIGFQESSPTTNAHHASIWNDLNEAQRDAKLKLNILRRPSGAGNSSQAGATRESASDRVES